MDESQRVFFDISFNDIELGRIVIELFNHLVPRTCENFRGLCTGEYGKRRNVNLTYKGSTFHRIIKNTLIEGGDITENDGSGGMSIYGQLFDDEDYMGPHSEPYLVSMSNCGPNTNSSQFFITTSVAPQFDNEYVVFGRVVKGRSLVDQIENIQVDKNFRPHQSIKISNCGELFQYVKISWRERHFINTGSSTCSPKKTKKWSTSETSETCSPFRERITSFAPINGLEDISPANSDDEPENLTVNEGKYTKQKDRKF